MTTDLPPEVFKNSDEYLLQQVPIVVQERKNAGLEGLVKGLDSIIINTEAEKQHDAIAELQSHTGFQLKYAFAYNDTPMATLSCPNSANILITSRPKTKANPFAHYNDNPKSNHLPNTRLETFVFRTPNLSKFVEIQKSQGVEFAADIYDCDNFSFIQTKPTPYMGISYGYIQWHHNRRDYHGADAQELPWDIQKPSWDHLKHVHYLDHSATRVRSKDRDAAILEFMRLTNYRFQFAIYVKNLNSITSVARLSAKDFAMVFTSGITPFESLASSGPTEKFIQNYGTRTHHLAFHTEKIEDVYHGLTDHGMKFLVELVGGPDEGLHQTFTVQSPHTLIVNEYIHRYGDFDGFFTKSNVTDLTRATDLQ